MISCAIVGLGYWGPNLARNIAAHPDTEIKWLCDSNADRLRAAITAYPYARATTDFSDLLRDTDLDAVIIATPVSTHHPLAKESLLAGKHVLVEKPLAASQQEATELVELADSRGLLLLVDHVFVYSPAVRKLVELTSSGDLGEIRFIDSVRINLGLIQHDVNVLWDLAPHDLSIIDALLDREPQSVRAIGRSHVANGHADVSYLHLDYGSISASVHLNWLSPVKIRHLMVGGSRKSVLYNDLDRAEPVRIYNSAVDVVADREGREGLLVSYRSGDVLSPRLDTYEPLSALVGHFARCVRGEAEPLTGGEQGLRIVRILEAADQSLFANGALVDL